MNFSKLSAGLLCFFAWNAGAVSISEETQYGSSLFSQALFVDGNIGGNLEKDVDPPWNWNAEYDYTTTTSTDAFGNLLIDNTSEYTLGGGWIGASGWGLSTTLVFTETPAESLISRGGTFSPSYRLHLSSDETAADSFKPYVDLKFDIGSVDFLENFSGSISRAKKSRPISGIAELRQNSFGPNAGWKPNAHWKYSLGVIGYLYNRDVSQFQNQLDSPQALREGVAGFSNTTGGLPKVSYDLGTDWIFAEDWKASILETFSTIAADNSSSNSLKGGCQWSISKSWKTTASVQWDTSLIANDVLGILNVEWDSE